MIVQLGIAAACVLLGVSPEMNLSPQQRFPKFTRASTRLCAHRGGRDLWPENTLLAQAACLRKYPGTLIEGDARLTADGHIVLLHDADVDRTTNGNGPLARMTLVEAQALDAGYRFTPDDGKTFPFRGVGARIPTFEESLTTFPEALFLIELKHGGPLPEAMIALLRRLHATDRVILAAFTEEILRPVHEEAPEIPTCFTFGSGAQLLQALRGGDWAAYRPRDLLLAIPEEVEAEVGLKAEEIRAVQEKGVLIQVHTINGRDEMRRLLDLGVDSIITDNPDALHEVMALLK